MTYKRIQELKKFTFIVKERILININNSKTDLMEIIQFYTESTNKNIINQLEIIRKKFLKLNDKLNNYRIHTPLLKNNKKKSKFINQIKIVIFYFELILIESEIIFQEFQKGVLVINDIIEIQNIIDIFSETYNRIRILISQLEGYEKLNKIDKIFNAIEINMMQIYPKPKQIKKLMSVCKKLKLYELEKENLRICYSFEEHQKKLKKKQKEEKIKSLEITPPIVQDVLNKVSSKVYRKNNLMEIINSLAESIIIKKLGGVINILNLFNLIKNEEPKLIFTIDELNEVLKDLKKNGYISDIEETKNLKLIKFVPIELSNDPKELLQTVGFDGVETRQSLIKKLNWSESRLDNVLQFLSEKGICRTDNNSLHGTRFYFPGISQKLL